MTVEPVLYESLIDGGPGRVEVRRTDHREACLTVFDGDEPIYVQIKMPLAYGAIFGPDGADVADWQDITCREYDDYVTRKQAGDL